MQLLKDPARADLPPLLNGHEAASRNRNGRRIRKVIQGTTAMRLQPEWKRGVQQQ